jgi:hypothetical protein
MSVRAGEPLPYDPVLDAAFARSVERLLEAEHPGYRFTLSPHKDAPPADERAAEEPTP